MIDDDKLSAEDRLIAEYFKPIATHPGALALTDDAAFVTPAPGTDVVLKTDAIIGGVHFFPEDDARDVARKALRVNLSDLAAKGATPLGFLVSLALPKDIGADWLKRFALGLRDDAEAYRCPLFGGDTDRTPGPVMVSIAMFGSVPTGTMVRRAGAKAGDRVFVTGTIGDAALGLVLRQGATWNLTDRRSATICWRAICCRSRAMRWPKPCALTPRRRWTCPTAWPAISPSSAASPASPPASTWPRCRCRTRRAPPSPPIRRCARRR